MKAYHDYVESFKKALETSGKSPSTIESYCRDASEFLVYSSHLGLETSHIDAPTLVAYQKILGERDCENSIRRKTIGVRQFFRFLCSQEQWGESPFDLIPIPERDESIPDPLDERDIQEICDFLTANEKTLKGSRDLAILYLLAYEGIKAHELINLKWQDAMLESRLGTMTFGGSKARTIQLCPQSRIALLAYKHKYRHVVSDDQAHSHRLFLSFKGRDSSLILPKLTRHGLKFLLYELGSRIGITKLNSELLRHFAIRYQLALGKSSSEVMAHFGLRRLGNIAKHISLRRHQTEESL